MAMVVAGCGSDNPQVQTGAHLSVPDAGAISVYELAGRLRLRLVRSSSAAATLCGRDNTVLLIADPNGCAYVNDQALADSGGITSISGIMFVPPHLESKVRSSLRLPAASPVRIDRIGGRVVLDAGHGGKDPGAIGRDGLREKAVNLAVTLAAAEKLRRRGVEVVLTRRDDTFLPLNDRAAVANRCKADLFVSIHADAVPRKVRRSVHGFTVYVARKASAQSLAVARELEERLSGVVANSRGIKRGDYRVLVRSHCPAVLVELGFVTHVREAALLRTAAYQDRLAEAVASGVAAFLRPRGGRR